MMIEKSFLIISIYYKKRKLMKIPKISYFKKFEIKYQLNIKIEIKYQ